MTIKSDGTADKPDAVVLLAHHMDRDGTLDAETRSRADKAIEVAVEAGCRLVLMGWAYRADLSFSISDAMAAYATTRHRFPPSMLMIDRHSRDTVGDAIFSKRMLADDARCRHIVVVTSDYHVARTRKVFTFVYGVDWSIEVLGTAIDAPAEVAAHELRSIDAFVRTFEGVSSGDDAAILSRLTSRHPFYNGDVHARPVI